MSSNFYIKVRVLRCLPFRLFQSRNRVSSNFYEVHTSWYDTIFLFQSRNRVSSNFYEVHTSWYDTIFLFQSRNRVSSNFYQNGLAISSRSYAKFQSRNRVSSNFYGIIDKIPNATTSFNLVIECLLISTSTRGDNHTSVTMEPFQSRNRVSSNFY